MARCMERCKKGLVCPCSTLKSACAACGVSNRVWYSGCPEIILAAICSKGSSGCWLRCLSQLWMKNARTCSREGLNILKHFIHGWNPIIGDVEDKNVTLMDYI